MTARLAHIVADAFSYEAINRYLQSLDVVRRSETSTPKSTLCSAATSDRG